jgi:hypothetical protein
MRIVGLPIIIGTSAVAYVTTVVDIGRYLICSRERHRGITRDWRDDDTLRMIAES